MFSRVAIVNRGEAAMRFILAAREYSVERGVALTSIALFSDAEPQAMFVREADESVRLVSAGPNPYLDHAVLERALIAARADAVWVGWGFVAEQPEFAELCRRLGLVFIGPPPEVTRALGDKIEAKRLAERAGVPVAPWSGGPVETPEEAARHAKAIGYPLMVKATAGGGGRGNRLVSDEDQLADAVTRASAEAAGAFGDPTVFLERVVSGARHVEAQIIADDHGTVWALGVRDCSIQRRHQKVIEESASTALDPDQEAEVMDAAVRLAVAAGYRNAGTVEFLWQPDVRVLAFLEVNTRLQVEHPVTELTTGVDIVKLQIHVANGGRLTGSPPARRGHAIEVRLNAEDPEMGFAPAPGQVEYLIWPSGPGVRVDTGVGLGDVIPPAYDSMVAKIMAWGADREEARARVRRALLSTTAILRGGTTNKAFLVALLDHPDFIAGAFDTGWLDTLMAGGADILPQRLDVALIATAIEAYDAAIAAERDRFYLAAARGRPQVSHEESYEVDLRHRGTAYRVGVHQTGSQRYRASVGSDRIDVEVVRINALERRLTIAGHRFRVVAITHQTDALVEVNGIPHRISQVDGGIVRAPSPGLVVAVNVAVGDMVDAEARVAVIESMKIEFSLRTSIAGRVTEVIAPPGTQVDSGAAVIRIEPIESDDPAGAAPSQPVSFALLAGPGGGSDPTDENRCAAELADLRALMLGFDFPAGEAHRLVRDYERHRSALPAGDPLLVGAELSALDAFADLGALSRNRRVDDIEGEETHNPREYFNAYLQGFDTEQAGLPPTFVAKLSAVLAHYGVHDLERSPALEASLYRAYLAQHEAAVHVPAVVALLGRYLREPEALAAEQRDGLLRTIDRLISATQLRHPTVGDLARSVRFRVFDQPLIAQARQTVFAEMRGHLAELVRTTNPSEQRRELDLLTDCPQPLIGLMAELSDDVNVAERRWLMEVQTRRYYQIRALGNVRSFTSDKRHFVTAEIDDAGRRVKVLAAEATAEELTAEGNALEEIAAQTGAGPCVVDLYTRGGFSSPDELAGRLGQALQAAPFGANVERVTVSVSPVEGSGFSNGGPPDPSDPGPSRPGYPLGSDGGEHSFFTFSRQGDVLAESRPLRNLHPLIAERLQLWRLQNFDITRLPSATDVYLFNCTGRDAPGDERLVALAEVRDLTPLHDANGRVVALPALEDAVARCLDGIRRALSNLPTRGRPYWNRVVLYAWPTLDMPIEELVSAVRTIAGMTEGLGLEQVMFHGRVPEGPEGKLREIVVRVTRPPGTGLTIEVTDPSTRPMRQLDAYAQKVIGARRRGTVYPYEVVPLLVRADGNEGLTAPSGTFTEYDLDEHLALVPVDRPFGGNTSAIVVGTVVTPTARYPEGMTRVVVLGDPTRSLGSVAEPECRRINAAIDLAERLGAPVEWFAVCSGAKISMDSGTENMDWISRTLRRIIEFTQAKGEINVVVTGVNVGAQPYWNAEATMLMHSQGILVMTPDSTMVLTGKQALEYSGGVSAEDNFGIGGYDRIMGPNGQAQYWAPDLAEACRILFDHYQYTYIAPGERFARPAPTNDPIGRDVRPYPHLVDGCEFTTVGEIFSPAVNPERKKPFDIRTVMRAVTDQDGHPLERWAEMRDAETAVIYDAFIGGHPVTLIGIESRPLSRLGQLPADGPDQWTGGTLFPLSSKKVARGINACSGNRPLVVLANLSGFDGSPESLRHLQLEYGAEIGRAMVNFDGPIIFVVISRYHGGAFVVFSATLNENIEAAAVEGSYSSVIGGPPAAAVVFAGEVNARTRSDPRLRALEAQVDAADSDDKTRLRGELDQLTSAVHTEKLDEVATEFDTIHNIQRALEVGSLHRIITAADLRPYLVEAIERGMARCGEV
jgi:acetyl/propionyl-CoA carboxylase alpha subunit/acetyl-CoA carboxylase carboxyltransferase component